MTETNNTRVWIDPQSDALSFLNNKRPEGRENANDSASPSFQDQAAKTQGVKLIGPGNDTEERRVVPVKNMEVIPPERPAHALVSRSMLDVRPAPASAAVWSAELECMETQTRNMLDALNVDLPKGWFEKLFFRPEDCIDRETDRLGLTVAFQAKIAEFLGERQKCGQAVRVLTQLEYQNVLDAIAFQSTVAQAQRRLILATETVEQERAVTNARTLAEVRKYDAEAAAYERQARDSRRDLAPPPPPPPPAPPPPTPEEIAAARRKVARQERMDNVELKLDELDAKAHEGEEKVCRAKAKAIEIFWRLDMRKDEKRTRIEALLDAYGLDERILPEAIRELMEEVDEYEER